MKALLAKEVADRLSVREFLLLCRYFDLKKQLTARPTKSMMSWGHDSFRTEADIAPRTLEAKFDVFDIQRTPEKLIVYCSGEDGVLLALNCTPARTNVPITRGRKEKRAA